MEDLGNTSRVGPYILLFKQADGIQDWLNTVFTITLVVIIAGEIRLQLSPLLPVVASVVAADDQAIGLPSLMLFQHGDELGGPDGVVGREAILQQHHVADTSQARQCFVRYLLDEGGTAP